MRNRKVVIQLDFLCSVCAYDVETVIFVSLMITSSSQKASHHQMYMKIALHIGHKSAQGFKSHNTKSNWQGFKSLRVI